MLADVKGALGSLPLLELQIREAALYQSACEVEADETLNQEMSDWEVTIADGIQHESW